HKHARPADLDTRVLQSGGQIARLLHGSLQVFHAYRPIVMVEPMTGTAAPLMMMPPEAEQAHTEQLMLTIGQLADKAGISRAHCHIRMGEVADQLSAFARRSGTAIVVMGAVSRSAIARLFIGNTAERALDRLTSDVLIVKPRGFRSGIERAPAIAPQRTRARVRRRGSRSTTVAVPPPVL